MLVRDGLGKGLCGPVLCEAAPEGGAAARPPGPAHALPPQPGHGEWRRHGLVVPRPILSCPSGAAPGAVPGPCPRAAAGPPAEPAPPEAAAGAGRVPCGAPGERCAEATVHVRSRAGLCVLLFKTREKAGKLGNSGKRGVKLEQALLGMGWCGGAGGRHGGSRTFRWCSAYFSCLGKKIFQMLYIYS